MGEVFRKAEAAIYLFAGLLVVLGRSTSQKFSFSLQDPGFQAVLAELLLLSLMVLTLAWAYRLVRGV